MYVQHVLAAVMCPPVDASADEPAVAIAGMLLIRRVSSVFICTCCGTCLYAHSTIAVGIRSVAESLATSLAKMAARAGTLRRDYVNSNIVSTAACIFLTCLKRMTWRSTDHNVDTGVHVGAGTGDTTAWDRGPERPLGQAPRAHRTITW